MGRLTLKLTGNFYDTSRFTANYTVNGISGAKAMERFSFAPAGSQPLAGQPDLTDLWWGGAAQNGWGVAVTQDKGALFSAWYTYDRDGKVVWYTLQNGVTIKSATGATHIADAYRTDGAPVLGVNFDTSRVRAQKVGTVTFEFPTDYSSARMTYDVDGAKGVNALTRLPFP